MIRMLLCLLLLIPSAQAEDKVSFVFDSIRLVDFTRLAFSEVLREGFVLGPDFLQDQTSVALNMRAVTPAVVEKSVTRLLGENGYSVVRENGIARVVKADKAAKDVMVYRPKHRSTSYLVGTVSALFPQGSFTYQRRISSGSSMQPRQQQDSFSRPSTGQNDMQSPATPAPFDSGSSAYSLLDKDVDVIVFEGSEKDIARLQKLLTQLDVAAGEVLVRAVVYEVSGDEKEGSAFRAALSLLNSKLQLNINSAGKDLSNSITFHNASLDAVYSALSSDTRFKVVSEPFLKVMSGANARVSVGSDVPVLGNVQLDKNGNPVQSVEYRPSGVILDITPEIRDEVIDLVINQQLSNFIPTTTGVNNSPTLIKREISTQVGAGPDDVIILGGLKEEKNSTDQSGFPFLPRFLWSKGVQNDTTEILLVLNVKRI